MQDFLIQLAANYHYVVYVFIIIIAPIGPILAVIGGILLRMGYFSLIPLYAALMIGDLIGDTVWYYIGYHFGNKFINRFGKYFGINESGVLRVEKLFHAYKDWILFISKITNGLGFALVVLTTAGMVKIPFKRYLFVNLSGQFAWSGLLIAAGYFLSHLYVEFDTLFGRMSLIALFVLLIFLFIGIRNYVRSKIEKNINH